jgi:hypothetical protein
MPSPSWSAWFGFSTNRQLSAPSRSPSLSSSGSQASPRSSPSVSTWPEFVVAAQLSNFCCTPSRSRPSPPPSPSQSASGSEPLQFG